MNQPFLPFTRPSIDEETIAGVAAVLRSGWITTGPQAQAFEAVRGAVAMTLRQQTFVTAMRQYLQLLAGDARLEGVELDAADTPLVQ